MKLYPISVFHTRTIGGDHSTSGQVGFVRHQNHSFLGNVLRGPQDLENLFGNLETGAVGRRIDDTVSVRIVRRHAVLGLEMGNLC